MGYGILLVLISKIFEHVSKSVLWNILTQFEPQLTRSTVYPHQVVVDSLFSFKEEIQMIQHWLMFHVLCCSESFTTTRCCPLLCGHPSCGAVRHSAAQQLGAFKSFIQSKLSHGRLDRCLSMYVA